MKIQQMKKTNEVIHLAKDKKKSTDALKKAKEAKEREEAAVAATMTAPEPESTGGEKKERMIYRHPLVSKAGKAIDSISKKFKGDSAMIANTIKVMQVMYDNGYTGYNKKTTSADVIRAARAKAVEANKDQILKMLPWEEKERTQSSEKLAEKYLKFQAIMEERAKEAGMSADEFAKQMFAKKESKKAAKKDDDEDEDDDI